MDFILGQRSAVTATAESPVNVTSSQVVPGYGMMSLSEDAEGAEKGHGSRSDSYSQGERARLFMFRHSS